MTNVLIASVMALTEPATKSVEVEWFQRGSIPLRPLGSLLFFTFFGSIYHVVFA